MPDVEPTKVVLGADMVLVLVRALEQTKANHSMPTAEVEALRNLLWNADIVTLHLGLALPCSLAYRNRESP